MNIVTKSFGTTKDGEKATLYTITNKKGMQVSFTDYGANIVSIIVPDKYGVMKDVVLGYDSVKGYEKNAPGYGSFIGRYANRIAGATFTIKDKIYHLEKNDGENCLHGGSKSYNKFMYETEIFKEEDGISVEFSRLSPDMEQGFPGNLDITLTYTLTNNNELVLEYYAVCDADTVLNFTNHSYFNLAGHDSGTILNQKVRIAAEQFSEVKEGLIPTGRFIDVAGTPLDFRKFKTIGEEIDADYEPLILGNGYDQNFILQTSKEEGDAQLVAELWDEESGRYMEVFTDLPGLQLYSANSLPQDETGKDRVTYKRRAGICFETQYYPNALNTEEKLNGRIKQEESFSSATIYKFSIK